MIAKLIVLLQWIESSNKPKKWLDFFFSFAFMVTSISLLYNLFSETILNRYYDYGYQSSGWIEFNSVITNSTWIFCLTVILLISIATIYLYGIYKKATVQEYSLVRVIMNGVLPLSVGIILLFLQVSEPDIMKWYIYVFGAIYVAFPIVSFLALFPGLNIGITKRVFDLVKQAVIAFLIGLVIFIPLFFFGEIFREFRYMDFSEVFPILFLSVCIYGMSVWFILTYAWMELEEVTEKSWTYILRVGVGIAFLFIVIWLSPDWKSLIIDDRIDKAELILNQNGNTKESLEDAGNVWFLKWALQEKYLAKKLYGDEKELYARLYDTSIESAIDDDLDTEKYKARNSNATSMLARGENAKVELNFAKHDSLILSDIGAVATTITYEFQNTTTTNQEVVFSVILPNAESAMTDLRLGLNLEYTGAIAPRGAAAKVYQDSLRRNTDPALLEQTGPVSYRLRVFPVPSTSDTKTQGRQRVQFTYISPLDERSTVTTIPKTDVLNLKLTDTSEILTRVTEGDKALIQDSKKGDDLKLLTKGKEEKIETKMSGSYTNYCSVNTYENIDMSLFKSHEKKLTKNIVFFDVSKSVGEKSGIEKRYQSLIDAWKNTGIALDIYTYNFDVYSQGYTLGSIDFWGTTDMGKVIDYIDKNSIENANIVIVTDDNSYEKANAELKTIDYKKLKSNHISLIQVGEKIRTLKSEITKSVLATDGAMIIIDEKTSLSEGVKNIFTEKKAVEKCENYNGSFLPSLKALQGYEDGKRVFGENGLTKNISPETFLSGLILSGGINNPFLQSLIKGSIIEGTIPIILRPGANTFEVLDGEKYITFRSYDEYEAYRLKRLQRYNGSVMYIYGSYIRYLIIASDRLVKDKDVTIEVILNHYTPEENENYLQEEIAKTAHIINQSTSLIALENDQQRADLERYSQQDDKYDTSYQNFTNEASSPTWNERGIVSFDAMDIAPASVFFSDDIKGGSIDTFGMSKSVGFNSLSSGDSVKSFGGGGSVEYLQYIIVIVLFPLIAWFVLRRKPKVKGGEIKTTATKEE